MSTLREKKVILIGDVESCLIASAAGVDHYVYNNNCGDLMNFLRENHDKYGVFIVLTNILENCREVDKFLKNLDALVISVDHPSVMKRIEPKDYYEKLAVKYLGQKIQL